MSFHQLYIVYPIPSKKKKKLTIKTPVKTLTLTIPRTYETGIISCNCTNSKNLNNHHEHVITVDLRIIENKNLCNTISKGPNYRESKTVNREKSKESIVEGLDNLIKKKL